MVSLRRRKILGLCNGITTDSAETSKPKEEAPNVENPDLNATHVSIHPTPPEHFIQKKEEEEEPVKLEQVNVSEAEHESKPGSSEEAAHEHPSPEVKKRKRHRRKHVENREQCDMRGVYFKNMKWQAAIKVDKKQIHLGTVGSQEVAARLYDRAAFMCGREPNFELSEQEKQELRMLTWEEFLANTRCAIANKKSRRRFGSAMQGKTEAPLSRDTEHEDDAYDDDIDTDVDTMV